MTRLFQGHTTRQIDGHTGQAAQADAWYYAPDDYEGAVLWSAPYPTRADAATAALAVALSRLGYEEEFLITPVVPPPADGTLLVALADTQETTVFDALGLLEALEGCPDETPWEDLWQAILPYRVEV